MTIEAQAPENINDLRRRIVAGDEVSLEEVKGGIAALRSARQVDLAKTAAKKEQAAKKKAVMSEDEMMGLFD